jgi:hypothetical protein
MQKQDVRFPFKSFGEMQHKSRHSQLKDTPAKIVEQEFDTSITPPKRKGKPESFM